MSAPDRLLAITLDERTIVRWSPEIAHEREVAISDLLEENSFALAAGFAGPYRLHLSLRESVLIFDVAAADGPDRAQLEVPTRPLRSLIKDYFLICGSYFDAIKGASASRIESLDMARRGVHDEGSGLLCEVLQGRLLLDRNTARRLFTLICVLHLRA